jgi:hypothetical protein
MATVGVEGVVRIFVACEQYVCFADDYLLHFTVLEVVDLRNDFFRVGHLDGRVIGVMDDD